MIATLSQISFVRWLRMAIGMFFIFAAFGEKRWGMGVLGAVLLIQGILNTGCGLGASSCGPSKSRKNPSGFDAEKSFRKLKL